MREAIARSTVRVVLTIVGTLLLLIGIIMLVAPGPGILLVLAGMAVLAKEYRWPRQVLDWLKAKMGR